MSDQQTPIVETQPERDSSGTGTDGHDGDCCRAPGEPDGGPDT